MSPKSFEGKSTVTTVESGPDKKKSPVSKIVATGAAAALALGLAGCGSNNTEASPVIPTETTNVELDPWSDENLAILEEKFWDSIETKEELAESLVMPSSLSSEELGHAFIGNLDKLSNYGATVELDEWVFNRAPSEEDERAMYDQIATQAQEAALEAMFAEDRPADRAGINTASLIDKVKEVNIAVLSTYNRTTNTNNIEDVESFRMWSEVDSVEDITPSSGGESERVLVINIIQRTNDDKNRADEIINSDVTHEGSPVEMTVTFHKEGDRWVVYTWDSYAK